MEDDLIRNPGMLSSSCRTRGLKEGVNIPIGGKQTPAGGHSRLETALEVKVMKGNNQHPQTHLL